MTIPEFEKGFKPVDIALAHLDHFPGDFLFPLARLSKFPPLRKRNLRENCSNDPAQIKKWSREFPGCNFGIALRRSRLIVPDVDVSKGKPGLDTYQLLEMLYGWPRTSRVRSPSGGFHCIYTGQHVMKIAGFGPAVDSPNYIVCPGMPVKGGRYRYINALPRAEAPSWFYKLLAPKEHLQVGNAADVAVEYDQAHNITTAIDYLINDAPAAIEGEGGEFRTLKTAMGLRDLGISEDYAMGLMLEHYNEQKCNPPWDYDGLRQKVANGYAYASMRPIGGLTAEAEFAGDPPPPVTPIGHDREANFVTVGRYKFSVTRARRAVKKKA